MLNASQHGFRSGRSTLTNMLCAETYVMNAINEDHPVDMILLNFTRAFDKVPHDQLINSLSSYKLSYRLMCWFRDFLSHRTQYVLINGTSSAAKQVNSGVIQGSVVGPFLFTLFINSLRLCIMDSEFLLFADDSKLLRRVSYDGHLLLNADLQKIVAWSNACGMPLSVPKCCVLHYNGRHAANRGANYFVEGIQIASQCECADLGVTRQTDGLFKQHIANTAAKAARRVGLSLRSFVCRDKEFMLRLFTLYIRPILEYAAPIWSPLDVASTTRLELVQRRFTKCIAGYYHLSYQERLARLQLPSLKLRRDLLTACLIHKILHNYLDITPQSVGLHLSCNNTRSGGIKLHVPRPFCLAFKCSLCLELLLYEILFHMLFCKHLAY